jgi:hypothetical protein
MPLKIRVLHPHALDFGRTLQEIEAIRVRDPHLQEPDDCQVEVMSSIPPTHFKATMRGSLRFTPMLLALVVMGVGSLASRATAASVSSVDNGWVRIGNQDKRSTGLVKELQNGDVSCVMVMTDQDGSEFIEAADFDICFQEPSLIGKQVRLTYRMENVIAESCQGDPECSDTDEVAMVVAASSIAAAPAAKTDRNSLCDNTEQVVFSCAAGAKLISVCGAHPATSGIPYLQYRFGKPGMSPELVLPAARVRPSRAATGENVGYSGGGASWLRFRNGATSYVVYTGIGRWGDNGETLVKEGVAVERSGRLVTHISCSNEAISELGMDWYERHDIGIADAEEFTLP